MAKATDIRETPRDFLEEIQQKFGVRFDLDVCATRRNRIVPAYFGPGSAIAVDALGKVCWSEHGREAWMNCPYSEIPRWLARACQEVRQAPGFAVTCLLPSGTSTQWFHNYLWDDRRERWRKRVVRASWVPRRLTFGPHDTGAKWPSLAVRLCVAEESR